MDITDKLLYTKEHEWTLIEGNKARIGITYYAQSHLGDITYVELPELGKEVKRSEALASVESVKAASDIYAPLSGKVIQVNDGLTSSPGKVNKAPHGDGWIAVLKIKDESEKSKLMDKQKYQEYLKSLQK